jgi:hypothetical protein
VQVNWGQIEEIDGQPAPAYPTAAVQIDFLRGAFAMLNALPYVERYAWWTLYADSPEETAGLYDGQNRATPTGEAFRAMP